MNFKKILVAGIVGGIVFFVVGFIVGQVVQLVWPYNILELEGMKETDDPLLLFFFLSPFVWSFAMAIVFQVISPALKGNFLQKGKTFGLLTWLLGGVPSAFIVFTSMNYPVGFTVESFLGNLLCILATAIVIAKLSQ